MRGGLDDDHAVELEALHETDRYDRDLCVERLARRPPDRDAASLERAGDRVGLRRPA